MKIFRIDYYTGYMELNVDNFFPAPVGKATKVFKLMRQYCSDEQIKSLDEYLQQAKVKAFSDGQAYTKEYRHYHQKAVEIGAIVYSGTYPNGIKLPEWKLKDYQKELKEAQKQERSAFKNVKAQKRKFKSLERNIELLHTHTHTHTRIKGGDS